jgi:hypothetical protein
LVLVNMMDPTPLGDGCGDLDLVHLVDVEEAVGHLLDVTSVEATSCMTGSVW